VRVFEYRHVVGFEETNFVGNVYYASHIRWQGRCREMFLREHTPELVAQLASGLSVVTLRCSCEYFAELAAFDEVIVRMRLAAMVQNRMGLEFEYWRVSGESEELVARGQQEIAWMRRSGDRLVAIPIPEALRQALVPYQDA
jgi:enediyne biosynthesis thioesterase